MSNAKKIAVIGNCYYSVFRFRKELIQSLVADGYDVWTAFPNGEHGEKERGEDLAKEFSCHYENISMARRSINVIKELKYIIHLDRFISFVNPDVVLLFTIKPNLYGGIISCRHKVPYIINVTGLGSGFNKSALLSRIMKKMYRKVIGKSNCSFFQNKHDFNFLIDDKKYDNVKIIPGSGVNTEEYNLLPYHEDDKVRFLYMSRVMKEKGIEEYLKAADYFKNNSQVELWICGDCEESYLDEMKDLDQKGIIRYLGQVSDVKSVIQSADCIVHPSYYHEGISNVLLEASSCGRAIITTDNPGCKEVVNDGQNGFLINSRESEELIEAMNRFINLSLEEKKEMGKRGRLLVKEMFDRKIVVNEYRMAIDAAVN